MNWVKINGKAYDVLVTSIERNFTVLYTENTGRTLAEGSPLILDPLGTSYGHKVAFRRRKDNFKAFDDLWECISMPRSQGVEVDIVYNQTTLRYSAYCSTGTQSLKRIAKNGDVCWDELLVDFIPMYTQVEA